MIDSTFNGNAWYNNVGEEDDVVLSSRVRISRNLANFVFPNVISSEDGERVLYLVFDAFSHFENPDSFQSLRLIDTDIVGQRVLVEKGIIPSNIKLSSKEGLVLSNLDGFSTTVNIEDHVRLASFVSGLDIEKAYSFCHGIDEALQDYLQFAASYEVGYLTSYLRDLGSGMRISVLLHLPSLFFSGQLDMVRDQCMQKGFYLEPFYKPEIKAYVYKLFSWTSLQGNEKEQVNLIKLIAKQVLNQERKAREVIKSSKLTFAKNLIYRAVAILKYSSMINVFEGVEIIAAIKWGKNLGLLDTVSHQKILAMLYRVMEAHLMFVVHTGKFCFEKDLQNDEQKVARLRAVLMQEEFQNLEIL